MRQKFAIERNPDANEIVIREFAELDKGAMTMICEVFYDENNIKEALRKGKDATLNAIRNTTLFPVGFYAERIIEALNEMYGKDFNSNDLYFDDMDYLTKDQQEMEEPEEMDPELEIDDLLEEDEDDLYADDDELNDMNSLKISDSDGYEEDDAT